MPVAEAHVVARAPPAWWATVPSHSFSLTALEKMLPRREEKLQYPITAGMQSLDIVLYHGRGESFPIYTSPDRDRRRKQARHWNFRAFGMASRLLVGYVGQCLKENTAAERMANQDHSLRWAQLGKQSAEQFTSVIGYAYSGGEGSG
jgi:hypothetical protein